MNNAAQIILAIESAVAGGSISLLRDGVEVANWIGTSNVSKAEDLLANIDELLAQNNFKRNEIGQVAVSAGPGSFTGVRIGLATALGLKSGLGVAISSENVLRAMAHSRPDLEYVKAVIPMGRGSACVQAFHWPGRELMAATEPTTMTEDELRRAVEEPNAKFLVHTSLAGGTTNAIDFGSNLALAIANLCRANPNKLENPLFISKTF